LISFCSIHCRSMFRFGTNLFDSHSFDPYKTNHRGTRKSSLCLCFFQQVYQRTWHSLNRERKSIDADLWSMFCLCNVGNYTDRCMYCFESIDKHHGWNSWSSNRKNPFAIEREPQGRTGLVGRFQKHKAVDFVSSC
jgi:hypothetical protein